jgi:hypothetical protein
MMECLTSICDCKCKCYPLLPGYGSPNPHLDRYHLFTVTSLVPLQPLPLLRLLGHFPLDHTVIMCVKVMLGVRAIHLGGAYSSYWHLVGHRAGQSQKYTTDWVEDSLFVRVSGDPIRTEGDQRPEGRNSTVDNESYRSSVHSAHHGNRHYKDAPPANKNDRRRTHSTEHRGHHVGTCSI